MISLYKADTILMRTDGTRIEGFISYDGSFLEIKDQGDRLINWGKVKDFDRGCLFDEKGNKKFVLFEF